MDPVEMEPVEPEREPMEPEPIEPEMEPMERGMYQM